MANTGFKGIDVRQTGTSIVFRAFLQTSAGALLGTGTTTLAIIELQSDGTIKSYDFNDNTFKTTALTTATLAMTHRPSNNAATTTGYWTVALATVTGFTVGGIYAVIVNNTGASPTDQAREFQYGGAEGDLTVTAGATGVAYLQDDVTLIKTQTVTCAAAVTVNANVGTTQPVNYTGTGASALVKSDMVDVAGAAVSATTAQLGVNVVNVGSVAQTGGDIYPAVTNIAVTGAALNKTAASELLTTGTDTGGLSNASTLDGTFDNWADTTGTIDGYYQFDISGTTGAVGVGATWDGYLIGVANSLKVYAYNWGGAAWDQVGTIVGIAGTTVMAQEWDLTSAHTGTGGNAGLVRIRFNNTGLVTATLKTDRILLGYAVVLTPPSNWSAMVISAGGIVDGNVQQWKGTTVSTPTVGGVPNVNVKTWNDLTTVALPLIPTVAGRTLDVSAGGEAGLDWANIGSPTTTVGLTGTTISSSQVVASVTGAAGSVTGAVGSVTGSVGSIASGGITTASFAAGAIDAAAIATDAIGSAELAASAVTKIQTGLATPTNITAGTLTTVTNLTNAATAGDLTATMKTSVQTAADAAITANATIIEIEAETDGIAAIPTSNPSAASIVAALFATSPSATPTTGQVEWLLRLIDADLYVDTTVTPWAIVYMVRNSGGIGVGTELHRKKLTDVTGTNLTATTTVVGQAHQ